MTETPLTRCPQCAATVPSQALACPRCGANLALLRTFLDMQQDVQQCEEHITALQGQLSTLQEKFTRVAALLATQPADHGRTAAAPRSEAAPPVPATSPADHGSTAPAAVAPPAKPRARRHTEVRIGQRWLLVGGIAMTILGIGFFLKYAFEQNWVGPAGRILLGYLAAGAFLAAGEWSRRRQAATFGLYLIGGGIATLYLSTFAAYQLYGLLGQVPAFGFMVLVTIFAGLLALFYDAKWLAVMGLIGGFLTPVILSTGQDQQIVLMIYMTMLNGGILAIATQKQWRLLNTLGFALTWLMFAGWYARYYQETKFWPTTIFLNVFFLIYTFVPVAYYFLRQRQTHTVGFAITGLNTFVAFSFSFVMIKHYTSLPAVSLVSLAYAGLFLWLAHVLYQRQQAAPGPFVLLLAKGLLMLIITVPMLFSGHWITMFWAVQAVTLLWAGLYLRQRRLAQGALVLLLLAVGKFTLFDYEAIFPMHHRSLWFWELYYARGFSRGLWERWITTVAVLASLLRSAQLLTTADAALQPWSGKPAHVLFGAWAVLCFVVLNYEVSAFFHDYAPQAHFAAISVLWALCSIVLVVIGFLRHQGRLRQCGLWLFAITVLKVFVVDLANVSTPFRIISFVVLGLMLIGASYLYYRYREYIVPAATAEESPQ
jgi:uncharacterized membrane protein